MKNRYETSTRNMTSLYFLTFVCFLGAAESLMCFQCAASGPNNPCVLDISGLINSSLGISTDYAKDCTRSNANWTRCMIQTSEFNGGFTLFHRGCHDGVTFSTDFYSPRFTNLPPNNFSTCDQVSNTNKLICYRFCATDFCNGPQPLPVKQEMCKVNISDTTTMEPGDDPCGVARLFVADGSLETMILTLAIVVLMLIG